MKSPRDIPTRVEVIRRRDDACETFRISTPCSCITRNTAEAAGATITKPAAETFYGGYAAYFADLDGHLWEIAHNPGFTLRDDGSLVLVVGWPD